MNYPISKEASKSFIQFFSVSWLTFLGLSPYFLVAMALMDLNSGLGFILYGALFSYLSFPFALVVILVIFKKNLIRVDSFKKFVAENVKKVFLSGVIVFYLISAISIIININSFFLVLMFVFFSSLAFPVMWVLLKFGYIFFKKMNYSIKEV